MWVGESDEIVCALMFDEGIVESHNGTLTMREIPQETGLISVNTDYLNPLVQPPVGSTNYPRPGETFVLCEYIGPDGSRLEKTLKVIILGELFRVFQTM